MEELEGLAGDVEQGGLEAAAHGRVGDPAPHEAGPDDGDAVDAAHDPR